MGTAVAPRAGIPPLDPSRAGVGLRLPHLAEVATAGPSISWLEIHPENFLANPHARELLHRIAREYAISLHTVGLSVGSADGIDHHHLTGIARLADEIEPVLVSGHLAWSTQGGAYLNDLLPMPYDEESLSLVASQVHEVQDVLRRPFLVENPSSYVGFATSTLSEAQFLRELAEMSGCELLCDISNIIVSGTNMDFDPYAYVDCFPGDAVRELHLGGFTPEPDASACGGEILIDTHAAPIADAAWRLYAHALRRFGPRPTLIEWDNDLPELGTILREAERADVIAATITNDESAHAIAG